MKTLLVLRHGKSSWADPDLTDHDRPLKKRGKQAAVTMGQLIKAQRLVPDLIIGSTARRARDTAERVVAAYQGTGTGLRCDERLYHAGAAAIVAVLRGIRELAGTVLIVGHNPGLEELVEALTGGPETLPTAALAHITLPIDAWTDLRLNVRGTLVNLWRPREVGRAP